MQKKEKIELNNTIITHPDKLMFPQDDILKIDLVQYYALISEKILPYLEKRPEMIIRCPNGIAQGCFVQKNITHKLEGIHEFKYPRKHEPGKHTTFYIDNLPGLLNLINFGVIEIHAWNCRYPALKKPDQIIFDLDPDVGKTWKDVVDAAFLLKKQLEVWDVASWVKLTGGKGVHIIIPLKTQYTWDESYAWAKQVAQFFADKFPEKFTATMSKIKRENKIFIDYLRNSEGATAIAPYACRARPHAPIALPISWTALKKIPAANHFNLRNIKNYLSKHKKDPWSDFLSSAQKLPRI